MQYRWNEPLPKGTTADELSRYDLRRPLGGPELAGFFIFSAPILLLFYHWLFDMPEHTGALYATSYWWRLYVGILQTIAIFAVGTWLPMWVNHHIFKMDYREAVAGKKVWMRQSQTVYLGIYIALMVIGTVWQVAKNR